jgi:hypothetical protein
MATPSGLSAQLGAKAETTFGTYVAPDAFYEFDSETLQRQNQYLTSTGLRAGRMAAPVGRHKNTTRSASGDINMKVPNKGFGRFLNLLHGNVVTPTKVGPSLAYLQTHNIGTTAPIGKSLTVQVGKPDTAGTVQPFSYLGAKITSAQFSCATGAELMAQLSLNAQDEVTSKSLATASYPSGLASLDFTGGSVSIGSDTLAIITDASLTVPLPQKLDRYGLGTGALAAEPIPNDYIRPTGSLTMEFNTLTQYNHFVNCDTVEVVLDFKGAVIETSYNEELKFDMKACHFTGATPQVGGPDILTAQFPFEVYDDGTNAPIICTYQSIDTTL